MKPPIVYDKKDKKFLTIIGVIWNKRGLIKEFYIKCFFRDIICVRKYNAKRYIVNPTCGLDCVYISSCVTDSSFDNKVCNNFRLKEE